VPSRNVIRVKLSLDVFVSDVRGERPSDASAWSADHAGRDRFRSPSLTLPGVRWQAECMCRVLTLAVLGVMLVSCSPAAQVAPAQGSASWDQPIVRALVSADGRQVIVPVDESGCVTVVLRSTETAHQVVLTAATTPQRTACQQLAASGQVAATLAAPLAGRSLIDRTSGKPVPYFDGRTLLPLAHVPPGYHVAQDEVDMVETAPVLRPGGTTCWTRRYAGPSGSPIIEIMQSQSATPALLALPFQRAVTINGVPAALRAANGVEALTWTAANTGLTVTTTAGPALSPDELIAIASGMHR
jgi:hypothetical protein